MTDNNSDDEIQLPEDTLKVLQEFLHEREQASNENCESIEEDWQLSQFWYSEETARRLVDECIHSLKEKTRAQIACISCPTLMSFFLQKEEVINGSINITLFEYDDRFAIKYGDRFVHYDYNSPLTVPVEMCHAFDLVVSDPPFLSEECFVKVAQTMRLLAKDSDSKSLLCTGTIMEELAQRLLKMHKCSFKPTHARNLGNDFSCFANFETNLL